MLRLERAAAFIFGFAFLGLAIAVAVETIMRKVFNRSLQGVDELGGYVLAVGAALSLAVALRSRAHIRIDVVHDLLPKTLRILLNAAAVVALTLCAIAVFVMANFALSETIQFNATAQTPWATPLRYPQGLWVIALGLFVVFAIVECVNLLKLATQARWDEIDRVYSPRGAKDELEDELADLKARGVVADEHVPPVSLAGDRR